MGGVETFQALMTKGRQRVMETMWTRDTVMGRGWVLSIFLLMTFWLELIAYQAVQRITIFVVRFWSGIGKY